MKRAVVTIVLWELGLRAVGMGLDRMQGPLTEAYVRVVEEWLEPMVCDWSRCAPDVVDEDSFD